MCTCHQGYILETELLADGREVTSVKDFCECPLGQLHKTFLLGEFDPYPELCKFALLMLKRLQENEDKGGWKNTPVKTLREDAKANFAFAQPGAAYCQNNAIDCANYLMMILDVMEQL